MELNQTIIDLLNQFGHLTIFLGSFFFGETVILTAAYLSGQGIWSFPAVFILGFLGTVTSDMIWFLLSDRITKIKWLTKKPKYQATQQTITQLVGKDRPFLVLLFIKFLYGTRILIIFYLSSIRLKLFKFLLWDSIGTIIWLSLLLSLGWFAGKGLANLLPFFKRMEFALLGLVAIIIFYKAISIWIEKRTLKK